MSPTPEMRIGDAERDAAVSALGEHFAAGRLTKEEFDERSGRAWSATTQSQLLPLFADLPAPRPDAAPRFGQPGRPAQGFGWPAQPAPSRSQYPARRRSRLPLAPFLLVVLVLVAVTHVPWPLFLLLGWLLWSGAFRGWSRHR
jgi:hypothetical protein